MLCPNHHNKENNCSENWLIFNYFLCTRQKLAYKIFSRCLVGEICCYLNLRVVPYYSRFPVFSGFKDVSPSAWLCYQWDLHSHFELEMSVSLSWLGTQYILIGLLDMTYVVVRTCGMRCVEFQVQELN